MKIIEIFYSSIRALGANKARTFLTMLGVIIGVFAVVSLVSLVKGVENFIVDRFNSLGSNLLFISPGRSGFDSDPALSFSNNKLDEKHVVLIEENVGKDLVGVTPSIRLGKTVKYKNKSYYSIVIGTNENVLDLINIEVEKGNYFTKNDVNSKTKVAIIGPAIAKEFFGNSNAMGKVIKIDGIGFTVIGVSKEKGGLEDERVVMPYTTMQSSLGVKNFSNIVTKAKNSDEIA